MKKEYQVIAIVGAIIIGLLVIAGMIKTLDPGDTYHVNDYTEPSTRSYRYTQGDTSEVETTTEKNKETTTEEKTKEDTSTTDAPSMAELVQENLELYFDNVEVHSFEDGSVDIYCRIIIDDITEYTDEKAKDFFSAARAAIVNSRFRYSSTGMITFSIVEEDITLVAMHYGYQNLFLVSWLSTPNTGGNVVYAFKKAYNENAYFSKIDQKNILGE